MCIRDRIPSTPNGEDGPLAVPVLREEISVNGPAGRYEFVANLEAGGDVYKRQIKALLEVTEVNAEFIDGRIHKHSEVHLGFACDTPRGLIVPVVRNAHQLTIAELAVKMEELAGQAVKGTIALDDLSGGTFTISNLGSLGIESFTPLLNPPQVAILGIGAIQLRAIRRAGKVEFIDAISLSLTCDHQIVDGAPGARFLKVVRERIENVESLCAI